MLDRFVGPVDSDIHFSRSRGVGDNFRDQQEGLAIDRGQRHAGGGALVAGAEVTALAADAEADAAVVPLRIEAPLIRGLDRNVDRAEFTRRGPVAPEEEAEVV